MLLKLKQIFVIFLFLKNSHQITIECEFRYEYWNYIGGLQTCDVRHFTNMGEPTIRFKNVARHDIKGINFWSPLDTNVTIFPRNLLDVFPNLIAIFIYKDSTSKISSVDLEAYKDLEWFGITGSSITYLPGDLFKFNTKLKYVQIWANGQLENVGENLLGNLKHLKIANFAWNKCMTEDFKADTPEKINELKKALKTKCPQRAQCPSYCSSNDDEIYNLQNIIDKQKFLIEFLRRSGDNQKKTINELTQRLRERDEGNFGKKTLC